MGQGDNHTKDDGIPRTTATPHQPSSDQGFPMSRTERVNHSQAKCGAQGNQKHPWRIGGLLYQTLKNTSRRPLHGPIGVRSIMGGQTSTSDEPGQDHQGKVASDRHV